MRRFAGGIQTTPDGQWNLQTAVRFLPNPDLP